MLNLTNKIFIQNAVVLSVVMLSDVTPSKIAWVHKNIFSLYQNTTTYSGLTSSGVEIGRASD
jgi:hypothetical protein